MRPDPARRTAPARPSRSPRLLPLALAVALTAACAGETRRADVAAALDAPPPGADSARPDEVGPSPEDGARRDGTPADVPGGGADTPDLVAAAPDAAPADGAPLDVPPDPGAADVAAVRDGRVWPEGLHGTRIVESRPLPAFTQVVDHTGRAVGPADLLGAPTVLWFYPAASTSG
jgi:hypothetical protein